MLCWSQHRHAPYYLAGVSFAESSFFPIPPDVLLISMGLAKPSQVWRYAGLTTLTSVLGGILGYVIGVFFLHIIYPWLVYFGYLPAYQMAQTWFQHWGFWAILIAGFAPIPYKIFTIGAGAIHMTFLPFLFASILGRGLRFFLLAMGIACGGERLQQYLARSIDRLAWILLTILILAYIAYKYI